MATALSIPGLSQIISRYSCLLLDQFGVLHDGQRPYPHAVTVLQKLHSIGVKTIVLSNSSRRSSSTFRNLHRLDIDANSLISSILTSGDLAYKTLTEYTALHPDARVLHFNWGSTSRNPISIHHHGFRNIVTPNLPTNPQTDNNSAIILPTSLPPIDVVVAHGTAAVTLPDATVRNIPWQTALSLARAVAQQNANIPFYVANPDIVTVDGAHLRPMPGAIAAAFQQAGGRHVYRLGKPERIAYDEALRMADVAPGKVLAVGDSLAHDILGAANAGIDSLYIAGGINAQRFGIRAEEGFSDSVPTFKWDPAVLDRLIAEEAPELGERRPTYVSPFLSW